MGIHIGVSSSRCGPERAWYPSGPRIDGSKSENTPTPAKKKKERKLPNPDPANYKIIQAEEIGNFLIIKINYPDCTTYEGNKILLFRDVTLIDLVNQKYIDPHFFQDSKFVSPIARFVPTTEGWEMAQKLVVAMS